MSGKLPAIQFYPTDWRKDPGVQSLDHFHKGVWIDLLCLMHESPERGYLLLPSGNPMPVESAARIIGLDAIAMRGACEVLVEYGVASVRSDDGALFSRRMVRDQESRSRQSKAGKKAASARWGKDSDSKSHLNRMAIASESHDAEPMRFDGSSSSSSPSTSISRSAAQNKRARAAKPSPEFEAWWESYPRRPGKARGNRGEAWVEWQRLKPEQHEQIRQATRNLARAVDNGATLPKDAQRFLRPPNKAVGADPAFIEWLDVGGASKYTRRNDRIMESGGTMDRIMADD